ncbi:MAG TPA: glutamine synthetase family protein [Armatimonadota bacterium]|nr:glutamine synthetase family protein [Armatimonadota bacterium]
MKDNDYVLKMAKERNVRFIRLWFTDILGFLKSFAITPSELEKALNDGMGFDGSSIEGFARIDESDMIAMPDTNTFQLLPWRSKADGAVARVFCDITHPDGTPYDGDPRWVLKTTLKRTADKGLTFYVGPELEYFYFKSSKGAPEGLDEGGYFDLTPLDSASDLRRDTVMLLEEMGIEVEYSHHEVAPSQHEIDLRYTDALTMADNVMTYRLVVKEIAMKYGVYATFMPKPLYGQNGSGMHTHQSLFKNSRNTFFDAKDKHHLSKTARSYIAGLLKHAPEITLVTNQWVNSYKRLVPGYEAPAYVSWALRNRSDLIRIPAYKPGREEATRVEYRSPDPACNPYLAFAVMLSAGLEGIEKGYPLPDPVERNVYEMTDEERCEAGVTTLPENLHEAILVAESSDLLKRTLGDHVFAKLIENKKAEWNRFKAQITQFELDEYLPIL